MHRRCKGIFSKVQQSPREMCFLQNSHFRTTDRVRGSKSKLSTSSSSRLTCSIRPKPAITISHNSILLDIFSGKNNVYQLQTFRCLGTAHLFHPRTFVLEPEKQTTFLTKALIKPSLPQTFQSDLDFSPEYLESIMYDFEQSIIQTMLFCHDGEIEPAKKQKKMVKKRPSQIAAERKKNLRPTGMPLKLFLNFLRIAATRSDERYPIALNSSIAYEPYVSASWQRNNLNIQASGKFGHMLMSDKPLGVFATNQDVLECETNDIKWDDIISPVFHMVERDNSKLRTIKSFNDGAPYPHPHTLFIVHNRHKKPHELLGHGIMYSFAHAFSNALSNPNNSIGMDKIDPVPIQCVITDGKAMSFLCYQLNTLNLENNSGIKNFAWMEPGVSMFEEAILDTSESNEVDISLTGFNKHCFELFLKFVLNY